MKYILLVLTSILFACESEAQHPIRGVIQSSQAYPTFITAVQDYGLYANLTWNSSGTFFVERAYVSDYSDALQVYTGTATNYTDDKAVLGGICYYRVKKGAGGAWVNGTYNATISDGTTGTRLVGHGDSITHGDLASPLSNGYIFQIPVLKSWASNTSDVIGNSGYAISTNSCGTNVWDYVNGPAAKTVNQNYAVLAYGLNDYNCVTVSSSVYYSACVGWINSMVTHGWPKNRLLIIGPFRISGVTQPSATYTRMQDFVAKAKAAADDNGVGFVSVFEYQESVNMVLSDSFHPNNTQHGQIATWLAKYLK